MSSLQGKSTASAVYKFQAEYLKVTALCRKYEINNFIHRSFSWGLWMRYLKKLVLLNAN